MRIITADIIYPVHQEPIKNGVVIIDDNHKILAIEKDIDKHKTTVEKYKGALIPGFVNTHCHLELSHMKGKVSTGTGLINFITEVVTKREVPQEEINEAIIKAEKEMWDNGIMAVGDISNVIDTFPAKEKSKMKFYTFVEMFDLLQSHDAQNTFDKYKAVYDALKTPNGSKKSIVPHAPYSVSQNLFDLIQKATPESGATISIHNQETPPENELLENGTGKFIEWYKSFGLEVNDFNPVGKSAIHYPLQNLNPDNRTLFVHNTLTTKEDIQAAQEWSKNTYWATCPNANLYIENSLPNYQHFLDCNAKMTIGTDSLTSNWQLSILEEMKTISKYQSYIPFETLLKWATINGAEALGFEQDLGTMDTGKTPGILLLENFNGKLESNTTVKRII